ncbi:MAG: hypothetical protein E6H66_10140, partial [Betaproteobacteria bacterium]
MAEPATAANASGSPPAGEPVPPSDGDRRRRWLLIVVLLALAAALAAVWISSRNSQRELRLEVAKRLGSVEVAEATSRAAIKEAQEALRETQAKMSLLETRLAESQTQQAALEALYRELAPSRDEWALTEIEQVLLLASQQLQLA